MALRKDTIQALHELAEIVMGQSTATDARAFYERHWPAYYRARGPLLLDPAVQNRSQSELEDDLWSLLDDLNQNRDTYCEAARLAERLQEFVEGVTRRTDEYEVAISIDYLGLPDGDITIGRTTFAHFGENRVHECGIRPDNPVSLAKDVVRRATGIVRTNAGSFDKAWCLTSIGFAGQIDSRVAGSVQAARGSRTCGRSR